MERWLPSIAAGTRHLDVAFLESTVGGSSAWALRKDGHAQIGKSTILGFPAFSVNESYLLSTTL